MYDGSSKTIQIQRGHLVQDRIELNYLPEPEFEVSAIKSAHEIIGRALEGFREEDYYQSDTEGNAGREVERKTVILNEEFQIKEYEDYIILSHPLWLLTGRGKTIEEARENLIYEAEIFADSYLPLSDEELTKEGIRMRDFIAEILNI